MNKKAVTIAVIGNPNTGKSTIFNSLTGLKQHVGNWPGVTVEKKVGEFTHKGINFKVIDLPGVYGLSAESIDEKIARDFIVKTKPKVVIDILDASNLERNLYLTLQLLEIGANVLLVLNKVDIAKERGYEINAKKLGELLGIPVVTTIAYEGIGIEKLKDKIVDSLNKKAPILDYPKFTPYIVELVNIISNDKKLKRNYNVKWLAIKLLEGDPEVRNIIRTECENKIKNKIFDKVIKIRNRFKTDMELELANERYSIISHIVKKVMHKKKGKLTVSDMLDEVFTHKYLGLPSFFVLLWMAFKFTFDVSAPFKDMITMFFGWIGDHASSIIQNPVLASFIKDGICNGFGTVLSFLPPIAFLFLMFSLLEDSGYMARAAFVMDRLMKKCGLHGKSVIPLVMGFGCNVPAIMATRTLEDEKDRILTIIVNPLMSCSARLPVYVLLASALFAGKEGTVITSMYIIGILVALFLAWIFKKIIFKGKPSHFVMELPPYNRPTWRSILGPTWTRTKLFLRKAGTIIFAVVVLVWLLSITGPTGFLGNTEQIDKSWVSVIGHALQPLFQPMGWDWKIVVALFFGFLAKESVVGTLGTLNGVEEEKLGTILAHTLTPVNAFALMVFTLLYVPCVASMATVKQEAGTKWMLLTIAYELIVAYLMSLLIIWIGGIT